MVKLLSLIPSALAVFLLSGCTFWSGRSADRGGYGGISRDSSWFFSPEVLGVTAIIVVLLVLFSLDRRVRA